MDLNEEIEKKYRALEPLLDEATLRLWAAVEARSLGRGGVSLVARAIGISRTTIYAGLAELDAADVAQRRRLPPAPGAPSRRIRAPGGGRKRLADLDASLLVDLDALVEPTSRGDPKSALRWTCKSTTRLAEELGRMGHQVSRSTVCDLLAQMGYSLQSVRKTREGTQHSDRDAQFRYIADMVAQYQRQRQPVISVDTKKKEMVGDFKNAGREWQPKGQPEPVRVHDFIDPELGKVAPYGVYDVTANEGWVSVGINHDTAEFAVQTIRRWWLEMGRPLYPRARRLLTTADCGGSNGNRVRLWRVQLQQLADELGADGAGLSLPARHKQVEQDRAPPVLSHHEQLAWSATADTRGRGQPHRQREHYARAKSARGTRRERLRGRHQGQRCRARRSCYRARRIPRRVELPDQASPISPRSLIVQLISGCFLTKWTSS